jgi:hypothetical protein
MSQVGCAAAEEHTLKRDVMFDVFIIWQYLFCARMFRSSALALHTGKQLQCSEFMTFWYILGYRRIFGPENKQA